MTVTATVQDGFGWGQLPDAVARVNADDGDVDGDVGGNRRVTQRDAGGADGDRRRCVSNGVVTPPTLVLSDTDGITYTATLADRTHRGSR